MSYITDRRIPDPEFLADLNSIISVINANKTTLGISTAEVTSLTNAINNYSTQLTAMNTARAAAKSATVQKNSARESVADLVGSWAKVWRANPAISDSLLALLMMAPHNTPGTSTPPSTPTDLVAMDKGNGQVQLKWKRGNNPSGTLYWVEFKLATGAWKLLVGAKKTATVATCTQGQQISFRVSAVVDEMQSAPTAPVTLWTGGGALSVAA